MRFPYKGAGIALISEFDSYRILMGKRATKPFFSKWSIPGGSYDCTNDSDLQETAIREFKEETSIDINTLPQCRYIGKLSIFFPFFKWTTFYYIVKSNVTLKDIFELSQVQFFNYNDAIKLKKRPFSRLELKKYKSFISSYTNRH